MPVSSPDRGQTNSSAATPATSPPLTSPAELERDVPGYELQKARDLAVAALYETYFPMPYLDVRVVRAAQAIPAGEKVRGGVRKHSPGEVAERRIPFEIARAKKKTMQYGSRIWWTTQGRAHRNGHRRVTESLKTVL